MNVSLTPELERFIRDKVKSGMYNTASEVVREAIRLLDERDRLRQFKLERLRIDIQQGIDEADAGLVVEFDADDFVRRGRQRLSERKTTK